MKIHPKEEAAKTWRTVRDVMTRVIKCKKTVMSGDKRKRYEAGDCRKGTGGEIVEDGSGRIRKKNCNRPGGKTIGNGPGRRSLVVRERTAAIGKVSSGAAKRVHGSPARIPDLGSFDSGKAKGFYRAVARKTLENANVIPVTHSVSAYFFGLPHEVQKKFHTLKYITFQIDRTYGPEFPSAL